MKCPICEGKGVSYFKNLDYWANCIVCDGTKKVSFFYWLWFQIKLVSKVISILFSKLFLRRKKKNGNKRSSNSKG